MDVRATDLELVRGPRFRLSVSELVIPSGLVTAVIGANGAGKTTLLRLMGGLEAPTRGTIALGGVAAAVAAPRHAAYAFQEAVFLSGTVQRNLSLALGLRGVAEADAARRIGEIADATDIEALLGADVRSLSGGESKRVSLARTLSLQAPITLLDEPMAQLDGAIRLRLLDDMPDLLARFTQSTVLVTHDLEEAARLADRLLVMIGGEIRAQGDIATLLRRPPDADVATLLGYLLVETGTGRIGIHPKRLRVGDGPVRVEMKVRRVVDLGHAREVVGTIGNARVAVRLPSGYEEPVRNATLVLATDDVIEL